MVILICGAALTVAVIGYDLYRPVVESRGLT